MENMKIVGDIIFNIVGILFCGVIILVCRLLWILCTKAKNGEI